MKTWPYYLANRPAAPNEDLTVRDKYSGKPVARVAVADARAIDDAIAAAVAAAEPMRALKAYRRQDILMHCVERFRERAEELALGLCAEAVAVVYDLGDGKSMFIEGYFRQEFSFNVSGTSRDKTNVKFSLF